MKEEGKTMLYSTANITSTVDSTQYFVAIGIFLIAYGFIISEKINRAIVAILGAAFMIIIGVMDLDTAFSHVDWSTITLLIGMMILVNITAQSGVFEFAAIKAAKLANGRPLLILIYLSLLTAFGSAFLDNVTTVLLIVPVTFAITKILRINPVPFLISEVLFSNIGGTATLIGDPPNIMIGNANKHLDFNSFLINITPVILIIIPIVLIYLVLIFRKQMHTQQDRIIELMGIDERKYLKNKKLMIQSLTVLGLVILSFMLHSIFHLEPALIAILGAAVLMLFTYNDEHKLEVLFSKVEWITIFFFAGLFILVGGLIEIGLFEQLAQKMLDFTNGDIQMTATFILWVSGIASATIDNIPFVATMIPLIQDLAGQMNLAVSSPEINTLWWSLALGACLGGNGTVLGASANVIVSGLAAKEGHPFSYVQFLIIGAPITLITLVISHIYIWLRFL